MITIAVVGRIDVGLIDGEFTSSVDIYIFFYCS